MLELLSGALAYNHLVSVNEQGVEKTASWSMTCLESESRVQIVEDVCMLVKTTDFISQ